MSIITNAFVCSKVGKSVAASVPGSVRAVKSPGALPKNENKVIAEESPSTTSRTNKESTSHGSVDCNSVASRKVNCTSATARKSVSTTILLCPICGSGFNTSDKKEKHVAKCAKAKKLDKDGLLRAEELQERQIAERLSLGLEPVPAKKSSERRPRSKKADPTDLSMALALSESLETAKEVARRKEEEILLMVRFENLLNLD